MAAVRRLPRRQRECLVLRYYADLSEAEIASTLGISKGSVKCTRPAASPRWGASSGERAERATAAGRAAVRRGRRRARCPQTLLPGSGHDSRPHRVGRCAGWPSPAWPSCCSPRSSPAWWQRPGSRNRTRRRLLSAMPRRIVAVTSEFGWCARQSDGTQGARSRCGRRDLRLDREVAASPTARRFRHGMIRCVPECQTRARRPSSVCRQRRHATSSCAANGRGERER